MISKSAKKVSQKLFLDTNKWPRKFLVMSWRNFIVLKKGRTSTEYFSRLKARTSPPRVEKLNWRKILHYSCMINTAIVSSPLNFSAASLASLQEDVNLIKQTMIFFCSTESSLEKTAVGCNLAPILIYDFCKNTFHRLHWSKGFVRHSLRHLFVFRSGISTLSSCGNPQTLPELPPGDEHRLQRAALNLQQKLILREWLKENRLQNYYSR